MRYELRVVPSILHQSMVLRRKSTVSSAQVVSWKRWKKVSHEYELNAIALVDDLISQSQISVFRLCQNGSQHLYEPMRKGQI